MLVVWQWREAVTLPPLLQMQGLITAGQNDVKKRQERGLQLISERRVEGVSYVVSTDPQAAMQGVLSDAPGPGQSQAIFAIRLAETIYQRGSMVSARWVLGHRRVEENVQADQYAVRAA